MPICTADRLVEASVPAARISQRYLFTSRSRRSGARGAPALVEAAHLLELVRVGAVVVRPGDFEERGQALKPRVREEDAELAAEHTLADVRVSVAVRTERVPRVVDVQRAQAVEADQVVELVEQIVDDLALRDVDARDEQMARVEADAEAPVPVARVKELRELVERAADRAARACGVLDQKPRRVGAELERVVDRRNGALHACLEPGAEVRADVEDDAVRVDC